MLFFSDVSQVSVKNTTSGLLSVKCSFIFESLLFIEHTFHNEHLIEFMFSPRASVVPSLKAPFSLFPLEVLQISTMKDIYGKMRCANRVPYCSACNLYNLGPPQCTHYLNGFHCTFHSWDYQELGSLPWNGQIFGKYCISSFVFCRIFCMRSLQ